MKFKIVEYNNVRFLELEQNNDIVTDENDAVELVGLCGENNVDTVLLSSKNLAESFFDLKTGVAGGILLKFSNYWIRVAAVIPPLIASTGRFGEMVLETNRGNSFRVFPDRSDAIAWIQEINNPNER